MTTALREGFRLLKIQITSNALDLTSNFSIIPNKNKFPSTCDEFLSFLKMKIHGAWQIVHRA